MVWDRPEAPRGAIQSYTLYYAPPLPPVAKIIPANDRKTISVDVTGFFKPFNNYSFWVSFIFIIICIYGIRIDDWQLDGLSNEAN